MAQNRDDHDAIADQMEQDAERIVELFRQAFPFMFTGKATVRPLTAEEAASLKRIRRPE